jgi:predicted DNA binding CopG/RHH family protein
MKLNKEEKNILDHFNSNDFELDDSKNDIHASYAKNTLKKDKRINIRISSRDLEGIQRKAIKEGLPYQSLVSSVLHKYVSGQLTETRG